MLQVINDLPFYVVGLHAVADVTEVEFEQILIQSFDALLKKSRKINFILVLETDIPGFSSGAWCGNIKIGLKYFLKWNKVAVVTDQPGVLDYSDLFKYFIPGKFRRFPLEHFDTALRWVSAT